MIKRMLNSLRLTVGISLILGSLVGIVVPGIAAAACSTTGSQGQVLQGIGETNANGAVDCSGQGVTTAASAAVNILSIVVGIAAVIMVILAGFKYVTSGGDSNSIGSAKNTLIYAIVGLIIVAIAQFLVHFVINRFSS